MSRIVRNTIMRHPPRRDDRTLEAASDSVPCACRREGYDGTVLTVLYDRDCSFCAWTVRQLRGMDRHRRLQFVALQEAGSIPDRPDLARVAAERRLLEEIHVVAADGSVQRGGRAMAAVLLALPGGWFLRPWLALPGAGALLDIVYRIVADNRHRLAPLVGAGVASGEECPVDLPAERMLQGRSGRDAAA
jgi:predicted DCC family thiol-disulfide oxidoreductase YuxK